MKYTDLRAADANAPPQGACYGNSWTNIYSGSLTQAKRKIKATAVAQQPEHRSGSA